MRIINEKAKHEYQIIERMEAGIVLNGAEAKSASLGQVDIQNSYVRVLQGPRTNDQIPKSEFWVINMHIYPYKFADQKDYKPTRSRKLLLNRQEMIAIESRMKQGRLLLVPTAIYTKKGLVKLEIGLARGKREYEKREKIKKRDTQRDVERELRGKD